VEWALIRRFDPSKALRLYRPVCVGAATWAAGAATYRSIDHAVSASTTRNPAFAAAGFIAGSGFLVGFLIQVTSGAVLAKEHDAGENETG
jgi:hypothetical protein